jgi:hypothetical protein
MFGSEPYQNMLLPMQFHSVSEVEYQAQQYSPKIIKGELPKCRLEQRVGGLLITPIIGCLYIEDIDFGSFSSKCVEAFNVVLPQIDKIKDIVVPTEFYIKNNHTLSDHIECETKNIFGKNQDSGIFVREAIYVTRIKMIKVHIKLSEDGMSLDTDDKHIGNIRFDRVYIQATDPYHGHKPAEFVRLDTCIEGYSLLCDYDNGKELFALCQKIIDINVQYTDLFNDLLTITPNSTTDLVPRLDFVGERPQYTWSFTFCTKDIKLREAMKKSLFSRMSMKRGTTTIPADLDDVMDLFRIYMLGKLPDPVWLVKSGKIQVFAVLNDFLCVGFYDDYFAAIMNTSEYKSLI